MKRKDVVDLIKEILDRGARIQTGNVLREFVAAYEYAIGLERLPDDFPSPAWLAKASFKTARVRMSPNKGKRVLSDQAGRCPGLVAGFGLLPNAEERNEICSLDGLQDGH